MCILVTPHEEPEDKLYSDDTTPQEYACRVSSRTVLVAHIDSRLPGFWSSFIHDDHPDLLTNTGYTYNADGTDTEVHVADASLSLENHEASELGIEEVDASYPRPRKRRRTER